jgi:hypothetical protein
VFRALYAQIMSPDVNIVYYNGYMKLDIYNIFMNLYFFIRLDSMVLILEHKKTFPACNVHSIALDIRETT